MSTTAQSAQAPIGIFDSGIGGLSVLRHIRDKLPNESLCYFADSGFAPYGDKTEAEIMQRTLFAAQNLLEQGVKAIVVACNTATAAAIAMLRSHYPELIMVGVEPGLKPAAVITKSGCVGVIATTSTLASGKYQALFEQIRQATEVKFVHQACPGLVNQIERGELDTQQTIELLTTYLRPIWQSNADVLVLGCTHYPFVEASIRLIAQREKWANLQIIDTGTAIARQLERLLTQKQLLNPDLSQSLVACTTSGRATQLDFGFTRLLGMNSDQFSIREIDCNLVPS